MRDKKLDRSKNRMLDRYAPNTLSHKPVSSEGVCGFANKRVWCHAGSNDGPFCEDTKSGTKSTAIIS